MRPETPEAREARLTAELHNRQHVRRQQIIESFRAAPQPFWIRAVQNVWSRTFYLAPFAFPLLVLGTLTGLRPRELDLRTYLLTWAVASPVGFLLWVFAWKTYGAGTGEVTVTVAATAFLGWCVWNRGVYVALIDRKRTAGMALSLTALLVFYYAKETIAVGVGPIKLAIASALIEGGIPLMIAVLFKANELQRIAFRKLGKPMWRFLTQPVRFPRWATVDEPQGTEA